MQVSAPYDADDMRGTYHRRGRDPMPETEVERLQSIIEGVQADLQSKEHDKTSVYWRLHERLVKYAKDFP